MSWKADSPPDRRRPLSITARLTLLYSASAFVTLLVGTVLLYWILMSGLERADFFFVLDKVNRLEWALQQRDPSFVRREVNWETRPEGHSDSHTFYTRIFDGEGRLFMETPNMSAVLPSERFPPPVGSERIAEPDAVQRWRSTEGRVYCGLAVRARYGQAGQPWLIQVAMDDAEEEATVRNVQRGLLAVLLLGTIVSAGLGGFVARRGMKPVREIAKASEHISANQLNERMDPARWPEELSVLVTSRNHMLERLENSFERMTQFAADVAHDLRAPIHNMMTEAEVALAANREPEEYRRVLESSLDEFDRLSRMISDMLFLARAENPHQQIERVRLDARRELEAVKEFFDALIESRGVTVSAQGQGDIDANPLLFRRAITNLLSNALRYTPSGGKIVLSVENGDSRAVLVKVSDSGCGIPAHQLPMICERRHCANRTPAVVSEQTGLGLSIVKSIVELHGGSMSVDSSMGNGTTVLMRFPQSAPAAA
ncbi:MAG: heavy metal sensor histidine kinase [Betaproteobacteria bacterium]|nr:heavy metal sensor histidine kinase [Betaproteobacteria bacterium]